MINRWVGAALDVPVVLGSGFLHSFEGQLVHPKGEAEELRVQTALLHVGRSRWRRFRRLIRMPCQRLLVEVPDKPDWEETLGQSQDTLGAL